MLYTFSSWLALIWSCLLVIPCLSYSRESNNQLYQTLSFFHALPHFTVTKLNCMHCFTCYCKISNFGVYFMLVSKRFVIFILRMKNAMEFRQIHASCFVFHLGKALLARNNAEFRRIQSGELLLHIQIHATITGHTNYQSWDLNL